MTPERIEGWYDRFRYYRRPPTREEITGWLARFSADNGDRDLAAKLLDEVRIVSEEEIQIGYREALEAIPGWSPRKDNRTGNWVICGLGHAGESGAEMLRKFREANRLGAARFDYLFDSVTNLAGRKLTEQDTVVLVDDFAGTGDQVCSYWPTHAELIGGAKAYLVLTASTRVAIDRFVGLISLEEILVDHVLEAQHDIFSNLNTTFSQPEKARLLEYCTKADRKNPKGFGDCGLSFVLSHKTPNNTVPILHANKSSWVGLFPRYLNV